jgi:hypothetical protein
LREGAVGGVASDVAERVEPELEMWLHWREGTRIEHAQSVRTDLEAVR